MSGESAGGTLKVEVDRTRCIGLGLCEAASPKHFEVGEDGKLIILQSIVDSGSSGDLAEVEEAVASCPTSALRFVR
ncbi:MAG: ferredoxin [Subtercola sp.]|jgi:ferredoxin|nr:ferredoxin [Subtercola sp.]